VAITDARINLLPRQPLFAGAAAFAQSTLRLRARIIPSLDKMPDPAAALAAEPALSHRRWERRTASPRGRARVWPASARSRCGASLRYGETYEFRVRLADLSRGGPEFRFHGRFVAFWSIHLAVSDVIVNLDARKVDAALSGVDPPFSLDPPPNNLQEP
jgi:hypothetical protein